jgi:hypothetical protein
MIIFKKDHYHIFSFKAIFIHIFLALIVPILYAFVLKKLKFCDRELLSVITEGL